MAAKDTTSGRGQASVVRKVGELNRRENLFPAGCRLLVMFSGGQDSLTLLHIVATGSLGKAGPATVHALHVNHHLRGSESDDDEALVTRACESLGVDLTVEHRPIDKQAGNVQQAAREARRSAAEEVRARLGSDRIALGHTADDQAETLLYRMGRYGGLGALAGMRASDPPWVRPLLGCRRQETAEYCEMTGLVFAQDRGNSYTGYARTRLREEALPAWEKSLPGAVAAACRTAEVAAEIKDLVDATIAEAATRVRVLPCGASTADKQGLSAAALMALPTSTRRLVLHDWLGARATPAASRGSVLAVEALLEVPGSARRSLGGGWRAIKEYDVVRLQHGLEGSLAVPEDVVLPVPGKTDWGDVTVAADPAKGFRAVDVKTEAIIDADCATGPLVVRAPRAGDRLRPLGAPGSRKVMDILTDLRVPASARGRRPLVVCGERILWVCGLVIAEDAKVDRETTRFLRLSFGERGQGGAD